MVKSVETFVCVERFQGLKDDNKYKGIIKRFNSRFESVD